ncbi:MAG: toprim domain-containing protein [Candidatus Cloacimonetes bacterium]|nr:toprim domain-containing protein [Candidatus Cloacimonadota bacterium]
MIKEIEHLIETNKIALGYFQQQLSESKQALEYLKHRVITKETADLFKLGYAPEDSRYEWHLSDRLIFPFFDIYGNPIGFVGRTLVDETPKYWNSKESPIFQKSRVLYGLSQTYKEIEKAGYAFLVEGQFDVLRLYQEGITNVIGLSGSTFTSDQARLLCRYINKVFTVFDPDKAGKKVATEAFKILQEMNIEIKNIELSEDEDPDSFVLKKSKKEFLSLIKS